MTNGEIFFYVALGLIIFIGLYSLYLAVMLDRCNKIIQEQKNKIAKLVEPPF
jgi:hypothetical protein